MRNFQELRVWKAAHKLTLDVYRVTRNFPRDEIYGLTSQMRRASSSIGANLAEGCGRGGDPELARFTSIALGSANELEYHIILAHDLELIATEVYDDLIRKVTSVKKMLVTFLQTLKA